MIPAVAQTLAELLANGTSLIRTEQINFDHPSSQQQTTPRLNLYCYALREASDSFPESAPVESERLQESVRSGASTTPLSDRRLVWFDVRFLVSAWDRTALGEQRLLSEALVLLMRHRWLPEEFLAPELRGCGELPLAISTIPAGEMSALWQAIAVPIRPAFCATVTTPFRLQGVSSIAKTSFQQEFGILNVEL